MKILNWLRRLFKKRVNYIGGPNTLPAPLSREEEAELISKYTGEEEEIKKVLVEHNLRLVVYIARKFDNTGVGLEDLISIGTIGLVKGVNTYRADKNTKLATYASRCIENEILMYLRKTAAQKAEVSIDEPLNTDWDGNELLLGDVLGTEPDCVVRNLEDSAEKQVLMDSLKRLNAREKQIVNMRFGLSGGPEMTQKEVAELMGISQSYISRIEKKIIERLKKEMIKYCSL